MRLMRTTIDLPEDVHRVALAIARDRGETLSATITSLVRAALGDARSVSISHDRRTGLPVVRIGRTITSDDVRSLDDEP